MTAEFFDSLPRKRLGAGVLFSDAEGRILLVEPTYKPTWEIPGGLVEVDESPMDAAVREVGEELGIDCPPLRLWCVDWHSAMRPKTEGVMFVFDGGRLPSGEVRLPADELRSWTFCDLVEAEQRLAPSLFRRVSSCLARPGETVYLEHGVCPPAEG